MHRDGRTKYKGRFSIEVWVCSHQKRGRLEIMMSRVQWQRLGAFKVMSPLESDVSPWMGVFGKKPTLPSAVRSFAVLYIHISLLLSCMYIHSKMLWIQNLRKVLHSLPNWIWSINIIKDCTDCGRRGRWSSIFIWWTKRLFKARSLKTVEPQLFAPGPASLMVGGKNC